MVIIVTFTYSPGALASAALEVAIEHLPCGRLVLHTLHTVLYFNSHNNTVRQELLPPTLQVRRLILSKVKLKLPQGHMANEW